MVSASMFSLLIALWTTMLPFADAQTPTLTLIPAQQTPNSTVVATLSTQLVPNSFVLWSFNQVLLGSAHVDLISVSVLMLPTIYLDRISISASPEQFLPGTSGNLVTSLTITGLLESEEGRLISASNFITFNVTKTLEFIDDCVTGLPNFVIVQAESSHVGAQGEFFCSNGGVLFYANGTRLSSNKTTCKMTSQWSGQNDLQCWTAPTDVSIRLLYDQTQREVFVVCDIGDWGFPSGNTTFIYVGDEVNEVGLIPPFALRAIEPRHDGKYLYCQPATPFTRIFNDTGRSRMIPLVSTVAPFQESPSSCVWYVNQTGICDVIFRSKPEAEFNDLIKNGTKASNDESNVILINGTTHRYRFHSDKVTEDDAGEYRLIVNYAPLPGLMYALFFRVIVRQLPPPVFCTLFLGENKYCDLTIPFEAGTKLISVTRNGIPLNGNTARLVEPGDNSMIVRIGSDQVIASDQGTYIIVYSQPSRVSYGVITATTFILEYPFNPGLVIGVTIVAFLGAVIFIAFLVHVLQTRKFKRKEAEIQMLEATPKNARTPSRATSQPTQYRTS